MNLTRKMMRHGKQFVSRGVTTPYTRDRSIKKGTPYRRLLAVSGKAIHATKGRVHEVSVLAYRMKWIVQRAAAK